MSINKEIVEKVKTIVITALVVGMAGFVGGVKYHTHYIDQVKSEAKSILSLKN